MSLKEKLPHLLTPELAEKNMVGALVAARGIMAEFVEATEKLTAIRPAVGIFGRARNTAQFMEFRTWKSRYNMSLTRIHSCAN